MMVITFDEFRDWIMPELQRKRGHEGILRVILAGSRAREDNRPDSDWDVVAVLRDYRWTTKAGPVVKIRLTAPDGNPVNIVLTNVDGLNDPGKFWTDLKIEGRDLWVAADHTHGC